MKFDPGRILKLTGEIRRAMNNLQELGNLSQREFLADKHKVSSAKYNLIIAIEGIVDICNHLISQNRLPAPDDYADAIKIMKEAGAFEHEFAETLTRMVRFRNRLVHLYWEVDDAMVYDLARTRIDDIDNFLHRLSSLLDQAEK